MMMLSHGACDDECRDACDEERDDEIDEDQIRADAERVAIGGDDEICKSMI